MVEPGTFVAFPRTRCESYYRRIYVTRFSVNFISEVYMYFERQYTVKLSHRIHKCYLLCRFVIDASALLSITLRIVHSLHLCNVIRISPWHNHSLNSMYPRVHLNIYIQYTRCISHCCYYRSINVMLSRSRPPCIFIAAVEKHGANCNSASPIRTPLSLQQLMPIKTQ